MFDNIFVYLQAITDSVKEPVMDNLETRLRAVHIPICWRNLWKAYRQSFRFQDTSGIIPDGVSICYWIPAAKRLKTVKPEI